MIKRVIKYGKWFAIVYVAQAAIGIAVGIYLVFSGSSIFGIELNL